ncbi:MAG: hypothetical protein ACE5ES_03165, partial [Candidatus Nanoarchaeia archaeon]
KFLRNENYRIAAVSILIIILILVVTPIDLPFDLPSISLPEKQPSMKITTINSESCDECFNISSIIQELENDGTIKITSMENIDLNSEKAQNLIQEFNLDRLPVLIMETKNFELTNSQIFSEDIFTVKENFIVFERSVPYLDIGTGKVNGLVDFVEIQDPSCEECLGYSQIRELFVNLEVVEESYEFLDTNSERGKKLLDLNNINFAPSLLISKNIEEYWWVFDGLIDGLEEKENYYLVTRKVYPLKDLDSGEIKGLTEFTYLVDETCEDCYDPKDLKDSFQNLGVFIQSERDVDISSDEGKELIKLYNIKRIPTIIVSEELQDYEDLRDLLGSSGTTENGIFVFRDVERLNVKYKEI